MLINIPKIISPDLLKVLAEMGHGDEIVIADGNFPAASNAQRLIRCDGLGANELLNAILEIFPVDNWQDTACTLMKVVDGDNYKPEIWNDFQIVLNKKSPDCNKPGYLERNAFYEKARKAYAIVATGETARYANIILTKGLVE